MGESAESAKSAGQIIKVCEAGASHRCNEREGVAVKWHLLLDSTFYK